MAVQQSAAVAGVRRLVEHSLAGWNIGTAPYGYQADRITHPAPVKAAQGRTKTRLAADPVTGPVVTQIFRWRVDSQLGIPTITARLNASPAAYPPPAQAGWNKTTVAAILANPKYTGHMVFGRERTQNGKTRRLPPDQWVWSPEPVHPALIDRETWQAAQVIGAERGNVRDPEMPTSQAGRRYLLRSRIRCRRCQRRMCGITRTATGRSYSYYLCPHAQSKPGYPAPDPGHGPVSVREDAMMTAVADFLDQWVFGHERAALLAAQLPASATEQATRQAHQADRLRTELARIDTAEHALISELEQPGDPNDPATQAYRARIRQRYAELYQDRTKTETQLAALETATPQGTDPALLDELPYAAGLLDNAPDHIKQAIYTAFDIQALYNKDDHQVTIWATITDATPQTINDLLADPRTNHDTWTPAPGPATISESAQAPIRMPDFHEAADFHVVSTPRRNSRNNCARGAVAACASASFRIGRRTGGQGNTKRVSRGRPFVAHRAIMDGRRSGRHSPHPARQRRA